MQWCVLFLLLSLFNYNDAKDKELYKVSGADLIDLLRGFPTEQEALELERINGDKIQVPDGVYFEPEDEALSLKSEQKYLYGKSKNNNDLDKRLVEPVSLKGHKAL